MAKSTCSLASSSSASSTTSSASSSSSSTNTNTSISISDKSIRALKSGGAIDRRKRLAANARERKRMHLLNKAYDELRQRLIDAENKSKYDVLVQAKEYIQALATICEKFDHQNKSRPTKAEPPSPPNIDPQAYTDVIASETQTPSNNIIYPALVRHHHHHHHQHISFT